MYSRTQNIKHSSVECFIFCKDCGHEYAKGRGAMDNEMKGN